MVTYGNGVLGSRTISNNETDARSFVSYTDLTIKSGYTYTIPDRAVLQVSGTLRIDGTLRVENGAVGGSAGTGNAGGDGANGGDAGGAAVIMAKQITGSGNIIADGESGDSTNNTGHDQYRTDGSNGSDGTAYVVEYTDPQISGPAPNGGTGGDTSNGRVSGGGGVSGMSNTEIAILLESWLESGQHITGMPMHLALPASGGGGGEGSDGEYNGGNGGGGGAGGSLGGYSGGGGYGGDNDGGDQDDQGGGGGGGGGGSGGFVVLVSDDLGASVTVYARGGDGGDGSDGSGSQGGAGGGGGGAGSGGIIVAYTDEPPTFDVSGGVGGAPGSGSGDGENGGYGDDGSDGFIIQKEVTSLEE